MVTCRGCAVELKSRGARVYCSVACQRELERKGHVARWLATGEAHAGTKPNHYVRRHINAEQSGLCAVCGLGEEWNDLTLMFVLDHIDGDASNNNRANLRLVCPNCDSQLPTYKNRNAGRGRHSRRERYAAGKSF